MSTKINDQRNAQKKPASLKWLTGKALLHLLIIFMPSIRALAQTATTQSSPKQMVDALHAAFGKHPNARAVHAKGIIMEGDFVPDPQAKELSIAPHLQSRSLPVTFRFSDFTGIPDIADTIGLSNPRGLALKFHFPDGQSTDIVAHSFNGFPVATTDQFRELLMAIAKSGAEAAHPNALEDFLSTHPIAKTFLTTQKPPSVSYGTLSYFGVNAFKFTNGKGKSHFIRYQFIPEAGEQFLNKDEVKNAGSDYLSEEIAGRLKSGPVKFKMYAQIAEDGDNIGDPSIVWPDSRKKVLLGILTIYRLTANSLAEDKSLTFNPGNIPAGIQVADQMLTDRQRLYPVSVNERRQ